LFVFKLYCPEQSEGLIFIYFWCCTKWRSGLRHVYMLCVRSNCAKGSRELLRKYHLLVDHHMVVHKRTHPIGQSTSDANRHPDVTFQICYIYLYCILYRYLLLWNKNKNKNIDIYYYIFFLFIFFFFLAFCSLCCLWSYILFC
jgi:hypothetical protein